MASISFGSPGPSMSNNPMDTHPPVGYLSRKALPIKRNDAEPLTREDVQYDLLHAIFSDNRAVFTSQTPGTSSKITFSDLYVSALYHSNKCSKVLKEKMVETPAFAIELAKISILTNIGRINTTMAFFPEMKTALRTYHPVPSLQKTDGNAQDAPRIKNCLKAALLPSEFKTVPPSTPDEIMNKNIAGQRPPTSIVNLIFVLSNHAAPLSAVHFDGQFTFLDLFLPKNLSSVDRAKVFLWHIYHYLEPHNTKNPFGDQYSARHHGKAPKMQSLTSSQRENVDTKEEIDWGKRMSTERNIFLQRLVSSTSIDTDKRAKAPYFVSAPDLGTTSTQPARSRSSRRGQESHRAEVPFMYYVPGRDMPQPPPMPMPTPIPPTSVQVPVRVLPPAPVSSSRRSGDQQRSLVQQAWHMMRNSDPLQDSDEENADEHLRHDYAQRLNIVSRIRGKAPTPEPTPPPVPQAQLQIQFQPEFGLPTGHSSRSSTRPTFTRVATRWQPFTP